MFDLITIVTPPLTDDKIDYIVWRNGLQTNSRDGAVFYDNIDTKNLKQQKGIYVKIETNRRLKAEGSLHKYHNEISGNDRNNYNMFSMSQAKATIDSLLYDKGIGSEDARIYSYEIGLNLNLSKDCRTFLDKIKSIGAMGNEKVLWNNPKFKNERMKVTEFHTNIRKYFKVYDKVFESMDKKRKVMPEGNILRIETVNRRLSNCSIIDFFSPDNLHKMVEAFFRDWRTIQFQQDIITPKGTGRAKQMLCLEIMNKGKHEVLKQAKDRHNTGSLTDWEHRNIREFVTKEWDEVKKYITFIQSEEEKEFRQLLQVNHTILKHDEINK
ncbi:hypothetical protein [Dysgonomonas sp. GY617]|uniref:hypothetical protein n=1 Tax=Dysgonomonas sp. GY617 TaxID=2780420 RepID=UPI00188407C5|nr:hypothetical protein [Dysgonomonas sp. GY617]MBF0577712.1 hypothetical protein [Dysgonomonas sp. GY617]